MSTFTLVHTRAAQVYPNDDVNIPFPNAVKQRTTTDSGSYLLIDDTVDFVAIGIKVGDTVFNINSEMYALVTVVTTTELTLSFDIFTSGQKYIIYQGVNNGCYIYVPSNSTGLVEVETIGGDIVTFENPSGVLPVQVLKVTSGTDIGNLIALW